MARSDPIGPFLKLSAPEAKGFWKVPILFEDDTLLALDKPAGLLTSPDRYDPRRPNLMKLLHRDLERGAPWVAERGLTYVANAHRLDFETSGILLLAKSKPALVDLANQFGSERVAKTYLALVHGTPEMEFEVDAKLAPHPTKPGLIRVDPKQGKKSITRFRALEHFRGWTLVHCFPATGRTHQIRVHLKAAGFPIVGDDTYGGKPLLLSRFKRNYQQHTHRPETPLIGRVALHAETLRLAHPVSGAEVSIASPMPHDLSVALKYLRKLAGLGTAPTPGQPEAQEAGAIEETIEP